jgi:uncharacterized protein YfcZ (UPF0381/DUF406 family)
MAKYLRTFFCKKCKAQAKLNELTEGLTAVECPPCDVAEAWGDGDLIDEPMEYFHFRDEKMAEC